MPSKRERTQHRLTSLLEQRGEKTRAMGRDAGWKYGSVEDLVLDLGVYFSSTTNTRIDNTAGFSGAVDHAWLMPSLMRWPGEEEVRTRSSSVDGLGNGSGWDNTGK